MANFPYPIALPQAQRPAHATAVLLWQKRQQSPSTRVIRWLLNFLTCFIAFLSFSFSSLAQGPCPTSNCESGDLTITKVELVDANTLGQLPSSCTPGQENVAVKLKVTINVTSATRYGFLVVGNVYINSVFAQKVWQCYPVDFTQGTHVIVLNQIIQWPCGSSIELRDVYTAWDQQAPSTAICTYLDPTNGNISNCSAIDPKCRYYGDTETFVVATPVLANFTYSGSCPGNTLYQPINFSSPASGTGSSSGGTKPYSYSWQVKDAVTDAILATSTSSSFTYQPVSANNLSVSLTVTDASVPSQFDVETKTVTVTSCCTAPSVTGQPSIQNKCEGSPASFSLTHTGGVPAPSIRWQVSTDGNTWNNLSNGGVYSNVTSTTLSISGALLSMNGYQYRASLQSGVCTMVYSDPASLIVSATSVGGTTATAHTICQGSQPSSNLTLSGNTGAVVKWQRSATSDFSAPTDIMITSTTLTPANIGGLTADTWFRAVVKNGECPAVNSSSVKITVSPTTIGGSVSSNQTICYGNQPNSNLSLSGQTGSVVKWQRSTTNNFSVGVSDIANTTTTLTAASIGALTQDTWFRAVVKSGECSEANSSSVKITVNATSVGGSVASEQTICSGSQPSSSLVLSGHTGNVIKWQRSTSENFTSGVSEIAVTSTSLTAATIGTLTSNTWFRAEVKNGVCPAVYSAAVKINVQQPISSNTIASAQTICSGNAPAALTGSEPAGGNGVYSYQWQWRTTGSFANISGANDIGYAPGVLNQTTEFRRIVTAGSACSGSNSSAVVITISPESVVYPLIGSNYCATEPSSGTITLNGSYPNVSYQLRKTSDNSDVQDPQTGDGSPLTWTGLGAGDYYVYGTGIAPTYCNSVTASATVFEFDCSVFYTLTQGYYGNKNGKSCIGINPFNTIKYLLGNVDLVIGTTNSVTFPANDQGARKLNDILPGGSTPTDLPDGNCNIADGCFTFPVYLTKQGKINNNLLSQTITLSLNARWNQGELLLFPIRSGYLTTQKMTGCSTGATLITDCASGNTVSSIEMNPNVVAYLGPNATVAELLALANGVLGGTLIPGENGVPSYADVNAAVDCINKSFDDGRRFLDYFEEKQFCEILFPTVVEPVVLRSIPSDIKTEVVKELAVSAFPNPYTDKVRFVVEAREAGQGSLEVFNMLGQKVKTVYQGYLASGKHQYELSLPAQQRSNLIYVFTINGKRVTGKLLQMNK